MIYEFYVGSLRCIINEEDKYLVTNYSPVISPDKSGLPYVKCWVVGKSLSLARLILNARPGLQVDHIDRNPLNNTRANLRLVSQANNSMNRGKHKRRGATSKYKGVAWNTARGKWTASIMAFRKSYFLGAFDDEKEAAKAYNEGAIKHHGEYAVINEV